MQAQQRRRHTMDLGPLPRGGVRKTQQRVVQMVARVTRQSPAVLRGNPAGLVERVANQRMSGRGEVNADLVRSAGRNSNLKQGAGIAPLQNSYVTVCGLSERTRGMDGL